MDSSLPSTAFKALPKPLKGAAAAPPKAPDRLEVASAQLPSVDASGEALDARARLIEWALAQVGERDPDTYYALAAPQFVGTKANQISWCGVFCLAGLLECGIAPTDWRWTTGKGFVNREELGGLRALPMSHLPLAPGDIVVFGAPTWHHAIVRSWGDGYVYTIDGNTLPAPREGVAERKRRIDSAAGYYSLARLLGQA